MSRYSITLNSIKDRWNAAEIIRKAPNGARVEIKAEKRTLPQNNLMWDMLTAIALQKEHNGRKYPPDGWKLIFMSAVGREIQFIPSLDGKSFIPWGQSSSDLSKKEMSDMIDFMAAWGAEQGVKFHDEPERRSA